MNNVDVLYNLIENGKAGKNIGFSTGIQKLDEYVGGVRPAVYTLIFGLSGAGKSALALYSYIYRPLKDNPDKDIKLIYYSLEMGAEILLSKLLCLYIYEEFGKIIPYTNLMSWQNPLSEEDYVYALKGKDWLKSIEKKLIIYDRALNNKSFYHSLMTLLEQWGTFEEINGGNRTIYIKNNPDQLVQVVIDHISLVTPIEGHTRKAEMDLVSSYCVSLREKCRVAFVILQQENRNSADIDRIKSNLTESSANDLKDSGNMLNDCEVCIGVYFPLKFKVKNHLGYPIICEDNGQQSSFLGLRDRYRSLCLIKNRYGICDRQIPSNFFGELGIFKQLPPAKTINDFKPFLSLNNIQEDQTTQPTVETKKEIKYSF